MHVRSNVIALTSLFLALSCQEHPVGPGDVRPASSFYFWQHDTIDVKFAGAVYRIWAPSDDFAWAAGHYEVWRFDGQHWLRSDAASNSSYTSLSGSARTNGWLLSHFGASVNFLHSTGSDWVHFDHYSLGNEFAGMWTNDLWCPSEQLAYAAGALETIGYTRNIAFLMRYYNGRWNRVGIPDMDFNFFRVTGDASGRVYLSGERMLRDSTTNPITILGWRPMIFELVGTTIRKIQDTSNYTLNPIAVQGRVLFVGENTIQEYRDGAFHKLYDFKASRWWIRNGYGRALDDFVLLAHSTDDYYGKSHILHFDGTTITHLLTVDADVLTWTISPNRIFLVSLTPQFKWVMSTGTRLPRPSF